MRKLIILALLTVVASCGDTTMDPLGPGAGSDLISDANQNYGNKAFFWLAPIVKNNTFGGVFNPQLKPLVEICEVDTSSADPKDWTCKADEPLVETWSMGSGLTLSVAEGHHYGFEWHTDQSVRDYNATHRIHVFLTELKADTLGYADVQFFSNGSELRNINTDEIIELRDGRTLPGRFRIEKGVSCNAEADCGEGVIGSSGGTVTTESGFAGAEFPEGAASEDLLVTIRRVDPSSQLWERCLPTGLRQEEGCYEFEAERASDGSDPGTFNELVTVAVCIHPEAVRPDRLVLHKYDPDFPGNGVTELAPATEDFLTCDGFVYEDGGLLGRLARAAGSVLAPVGRLFGGTPLYATDAGRAGLSDAFSFFGWAEPADLGLVSAPEMVLPGSTVSPTIGAHTAHNHGSAPVAASGHDLRIVYTDAAETPAVSVLDPATTSTAGTVTPAWTLTSAVGVHTLTVSTRMQILLDGEPFVVPDPTGVLTVEVGGYEVADDCAAGSDCVVAVVGADGDTIVTPTGFAGVGVPAGALDGPIAIKIQRLDPDDQPGGRCLPTGLRQVEGCYEYDTEPALGDVNQQDAFNGEVVVAICYSDPLEREDYLQLHKYDPERPDDGVVALAGATEDFLSCNGFAALPNGLFERLAATGRRLLTPVVGVVAPRPLYATDAGRAGLSDAFSRIGWAEPVTLDVTTAPDATTVGVTDVVVTATTAHNHANAPATAATDAVIRFEYTDPNLVMTPLNVTTDGNGVARISLTTQPGNHNVKVSTQQEILVDSDFLIAGTGAGYGFFGAPSITVGDLVLRLIKDPTIVKDAPAVTVLGKVSHWSADGADGPFADVIGPNEGVVDGSVAVVTDGIMGNGLAFDGTGGRLHAPTANFGDAQQWTVGAWVRLAPEGDPLAMQRFVTLAHTEKAVLRQEVGDETDARKLHVYGNVDGTLQHVRKPQALLAGCWHYVVGTYNGESVTGYLDGQFAGEAPAPGNSTSAEELILSWFEDEALHGTLDEVEVHNRPLTATEVGHAYEAVTVPSCGVGSVRGQVLDATGAPLVGAQVVVQGTSRGTTTNDNGFFLIGSVPAGSRTLEVSHIGFEPATVGVTVPPGGTVTQNVTLSPAPTGLVVDGVLDQGEWDGATTFGPLTVDLPDGTTTEATIFLMNDADNLYMAVRYEVDLSVASTFTALALRFDDDADTLVECDEDAIDVQLLENAFFDSHFECQADPPQHQPDVGRGGTADGTSATGLNDAFTVVELAHPLNSGDALDFGLETGSTVGLIVFTNVEKDGVLIRTDLLGTYSSEWVAYTVD